VAKTSVAKKPTAGGKKRAAAVATLAGKSARAVTRTPAVNGRSRAVVGKPELRKAKPVATNDKAKPVLTANHVVVKRPAIASQPVALRRPASANAAATAPAAAVVGFEKSKKLRLAKREKSSRNHLPQLPVVVAEPPRADGKPRKNQAGLSTKELAHFRDLLLAKRRELVGDMSSMEREALRSATTNLSNLPLHMADQGTDNYEQEFTLGLVEKDRQLLREINRALGKIVDGTYGLCEGTGKPINKARLEFQPWAKYSIEYARQLEKGLGMMMRR